MEKSVAVAEDWHPTVDGLVRVSLTRTPLMPYLFVLVVAGGDDFVMGVRLDEEAEARRIFDRINHLVTKDDLRSWGFSEHY